MNGKNIFVDVGIANVFLVSRARQSILVLWRRSVSQPSANTPIYVVVWNTFQIWSYCMHSHIFFIKHSCSYEYFKVTTILLLELSN